MIKVIFSFLLFLPGVNLKCPSGPVQNDIVIDDLKGVWRNIYGLKNTDKTC